MRRDYWSKVIGLLNRIQGSRLVGDRHFTCVDTDGVAFDGDRAYKDFLRDFYGRLLAAKREAELEATRRLGRDSPKRKKKSLIIAEGFKYAPFADHDPLSGLMTLNQQLANELQTLGIA